MIHHPYQTPNGATNTHHVIAQIVANATGATATINSYLAAPEPGVAARINWQDAYALDAAALTGPDLLASAEAWLISPAGPFAGGTIVEITPPAEQLRAELISAAARRRRELRLIYTHDFGGEVGEIAIDADEASSSNILAIVAQPVLAGEESPAPVLYKCADNVYRTFEFADFRAMAFGLAAYVQSLHARESELIAMINAADAEELPGLRATVEAFLSPPQPPPEEPLEEP